LSLPSRERGLKLAPTFLNVVDLTSLPSRERGLKHKVAGDSITFAVVAPLAGAWIETVGTASGVMVSVRRSPRGSVD